MTGIVLKNLHKSFGNFTAVRDLDLVVEQGEFMALLGPSGCGKSTTMNMIAGMEHPSSGGILLDGEDVSHMPMSRRGVGFVFQNYAIFTHMTVRANLAYGLRMRRLGRSEIDERVARIAGFLDLTRFLDQPSAGLSVNILQRLAIGRSAILEPSIFLLDEPLSNVDAAFRAVMRTELKQLQRRFGQTMLYVTHDQLEAMTMADRISVMNAGELQQVGTPLQVYNEPENIFVARFIGTPGMNILEGVIENEGGRLSVRLPELNSSIQLDEKTAMGLQRETERDVLFGFRPEQVALGAEGNGLELDVVVAERIGARTIVHLARNNAEAKIVVNNRIVVAPGQPLAFRPLEETVRLFSKKSGKRLGGRNGQH